MNDEAGKAAVRQLLIAANEAVAALRAINEHERVCRELIAAKAENGDDLAVILSNVMRRLDNAAEAVGQSLAPRKHGSGFEEWLFETFCGRDVDLKMEAVPYAHIFNYDQTIRLATYIWECMEIKRPPWWSKCADAEKNAAKLAKVLALTDTGSEEFKKAFPARCAGVSYSPRDRVPGWRVVEKIREALLG